MTHTMYVYRAYTKVVSTEDLINKKCDEFGTQNIDDTLAKMGFHNYLKIGDGDVCFLEIHTSNNHSIGEYKAFAFLCIGENIETYAIPTGHDLTEFVKEYAPMLNALMMAAGVEGTHTNA